MSGFRRTAIRPLMARLLPVAKQPEADVDAPIQPERTDVSPGWATCGRSSERANLRLLSGVPDPGADCLSASFKYNAKRRLSNA